MNEAKIRLSADELILVENAEWILTKNAIIGKVYDLFGILADEMKAVLQKNPLPRELMETSPKISRGEKFRGLPYVVLDYPRSFSIENIFAIRTLFWWGKYFSVTLHLKGTYKKIFGEQLKKNISLLSVNNFYVCTSNDEWSHELAQENYVSLNETKELFREKDFSLQPFLKLTAKIELQHWNQSEKLIMEIFKNILQALKN